MDKLSFIIPVFNCVDYLLKCVESIEKIGLEDYEILLIDDGSTDGSGSLCDSIANTSNYIRCYHQRNAGVSAARNTGLDQANGDYIVFIDADDVVDPVQMRELTHHFNKNSVDIAIYGMSFDFYHNGKIYRRNELGIPLEGIVEKAEWVQYLEQLYLSNALSPIWNKIYRKQVLLDNRLRLREDMFLYEDLEYSLRCLACCERILFFPNVVYHYRQSEDEGNAGRRLRRITSLPELVEKIELALIEVAGAETNPKIKEQMKQILLSLYLVLAREKISVSDRKEIGKICNDFRAWFEPQNITLQEKQKKYVKLLLNRRIATLMIKRVYVTFRHRIAVLLKSMFAKKNF